MRPRKVTNHMSEMIQNKRKTVRVNNENLDLSIEPANILKRPSESKSLKGKYSAKLRYYFDASDLKVVTHGSEVYIMTELTFDEQKSDDSAGHVYSSIKMAMYNVTADETNASWAPSISECSSQTSRESKETVSVRSCYERKPPAQFISFKLNDGFTNAYQSYGKHLHLLMPAALIDKRGLFVHGAVLYEEPGTKELTLNFYRSTLDSDPPEKLEYP